MSEDEALSQKGPKRFSANGPEGQKAFREHRERWEEYAQAEDFGPLEIGPNEKNRFYRACAIFGLPLYPPIPPYEKPQLAPFTLLSNERWADVVEAMRAGGWSDTGQEQRIRTHVAIASEESGFFGCSILGRPLSNGLARMAIEGLRRQRETIIQSVALLFGGASVYELEEAESTEGHLYRSILAALGQLHEITEHALLEEERVAVGDDVDARPANAERTEQRRWMAMLVEVWRDDCGLPVENSEPLRRFLMAVLNPYRPGMVSSANAGRFLREFKSGKVPAPRRSLVNDLIWRSI